MGLIARIRRLHYVYSWRLRYWWLDTRGGEVAHWIMAGVFGMVALVQLLHIAMGIGHPNAQEPVQAIWPYWVIQLIIALVSAAISYAMAPKQEPPKPQSKDAPTTDDGQSAKHHFGTVIVTDEFLLAWRMTGTTPIKTGGGKK